MLNEQPYLQQPGKDERTIVAEMLRDKDSPHWEECRNFVLRCVKAKAKNIPSDRHEDIVQEVMYKITKSLEHFRLESTLKTWANMIIERCIIDEHRKLQNEVSSHVHLAISPDESDYESEEAGTGEKSAEEVFMEKDEISDATAALLEYADTHSNPTRDRLIIQMVIFEKRTYGDAAIAAGCNAPVVGYVIRQAKRYAREKMGYKL